MDGVTLVALRGGDDCLDIEIGCGASAFEWLRGIRERDVQRGGIVLGINGHGRDAHFGGGADHTDCNFAAIGNE